MGGGWGCVWRGCGGGMLRGEKGGGEGGRGRE